MTTPLDTRTVLDAWNLGDVMSSMTPATGSIHQTLLLQTTTGDYVVRAYRYRDRRRVESEHSLITYVRQHVLPAVAPLPSRHGTTMLEQAGQFYAVFPRASGRQFDPQEFGPTEIAAMGRCLAILHRALASFPHDRVSHRSWTVDTATTLAGIATLEAAISARLARDEVDRYVLVQLAERRTWLLTNAGGAHVDFQGLDQQVIHGDYQQTNLFFDNGRVSAIIDWDQAYVAPRAWEVVRTLHLVFELDPGPCHIFLDAYRAEAPLTLTELEVAAAAYSHMRAHDLWPYEAVYLEANDRARRFLRLSNIAPLSRPWSRLSATL
jgi:homoserine kinase type II